MKWISLIYIVALSACYKLDVVANLDAGTGFRCFASDTPPCPAGLTCCVGSLCGDELKAKEPVLGKDKAEGWCVIPPPPMDMTILPWAFWDLGPKAQYTNPTSDPLLTGYDEMMRWRCPRDDTNPNKPNEIKIKQEPNDTAASAISAGVPALDKTDTNLTAYEICPDRSAPTVPDVDVFKFRLVQPSKVVIELKYQVPFGDLDLGLFQDSMDSQTGERTQVRVTSDTSNVNDACITQMLPASSSQVPSYYAVVKGVRILDPFSMQSIYTMNNYRIRILALSPNNPYTCGGPAGRDGGS